MSITYVVGYAVKYKYIINMTDFMHFFNTQSKVYMVVLNKRIQAKLYFLVKFGCEYSTCLKKKKIKSKSVTNS